MADTGNRLRKLLESPNFEPQSYVKQLSQQSDGDRDLQEHRQKVQTLADETAQNLKKNVIRTTDSLLRQPRRFRTWKVRCIS